MPWSFRECRGKKNNPNASRPHTPWTIDRKRRHPGPRSFASGADEAGLAAEQGKAAGWTETPSLIVTSLYLRMQQTAAATIELFSNVPVEVWPIQEFTYLQPSRWNGTRSSERMPYIERYWAEADPGYSDGEGAESFSTLLERAKAALHRLAAMPESALVYVFSHGQFIQAVRSLMIDAELSERNKMRKFWGKGSPVISNGELVELSFDGRGWRHRPASVSIA